ncbi:MAG TPA: aminotransferase class III-fold pyridoxal phosphate-dependent enzyme [Longimicrobium sp.]|jgi:4-aminobutyrate aminotransferase|uniref:aspartate aminotransferase family protein n=1 Tax=Longimicrobium sp. TaxID=2029185 RepID=UPI002ED8ED10
MIATIEPQSQALSAPVFHTRFTHGRGLRLITEDGEEYVDAASGTFNLPLGYDHPEVVDAVVAQVKRCAHMSSSYAAPYAQEVLRTLTELAPDGIDAGWMRDLTGSTANECAVKIAQKYTGHSDVISFFLSHHGQTAFTTSISGNAFRREEFPANRGPYSTKVPAPYCYRCHYKSSYPGCGFHCVEAIEDYLRYGGNGSVACMIVEPVLGNGGNIVPPPGYFRALSELCRSAGILLIADEVQTGMGRTGHVFACEALELEANIITLAKGLGGIGIPVAAVLMESRLDVLRSFDHSFTSGANMLALAAAAATVSVIQREDFLPEVRRKGALLGELLQGLREAHPGIGDVRGIGMMWGLEMVGPGGEPDVEATTRIIRAAEERHHLLLRGSRYGFGNVVKVRPALVATDDEIRDVVDRLSRAIADVEGGRA